MSPGAASRSGACAGKQDKGSPWLDRGFQLPTHQLKATNRRIWTGHVRGLTPAASLILRRHSFQDTFVKLAHLL